VFSIDDSPFARAGLDVAPLDADAKYRLEFTRVDDALTVTLVRASGEVVLRALADMGDARSASNEAASVVLPPTPWRSTVVTSF
jgi:hypothetical protein